MREDLMKYFWKSIVLFTCLLNVFTVYSQEVVRYEKVQLLGRGFKVLISSIELNSDSTFIWTSEHDLSWSEIGSYQQKGDTLILYYSSEIELESEEPNRIESSIDKVEKYYMLGEKMYEILPNGKLEKRTKNRTMFRDKWRWLRLGYRKTYYYLVEP